MLPLPYVSPDMHPCTNGQTPQLSMQQRSTQTPSNTIQHHPTTPSRTSSSRSPDASREPCRGSSVLETPDTAALPSRRGTAVRRLDSAERERESKTTCFESEPQHFTRGHQAAAGAWVALLRETCAESVWNEVGLGLWGPVQSFGQAGCTLTLKPSLIFRSGMQCTPKQVVQSQ